MLPHITGKTKREEVKETTTTFNILAWIRARHHKWAGHILRLKKRQGKERLIKETLRVIFDHRQAGDILMDVPEQESWEQLQKRVKDKDGWRKQVHKLKSLTKLTTVPIMKKETLQI